MIGITILIISLTSVLGLYFGLNRNEDKEGDSHYDENYFRTFISVLVTTTNATSSGKSLNVLIVIPKRMKNKYLSFSFDTQQKYFKANQRVPVS